MLYENGLPRPFLIRISKGKQCLEDLSGPYQTLDRCPRCCGRSPLYRHSPQMQNPSVGELTHRGTKLTFLFPPLLTQYLFRDRSISSVIPKRASSTRPLICRRFGPGWACYKPGDEMFNQVTCKPIQIVISDQNPYKRLAHCNPRKMPLMRGRNQRASAVEINISDSATTRGLGLPRL